MHEACGKRCCEEGGDENGGWEWEVRMRYLFDIWDALETKIAGYHWDKTFGLDGIEDRKLIRMFWYQLTAHAHGGRWNMCRGHKMLLGGVIIVKPLKLGKLGAGWTIFVRSELIGWPELTIKGEPSTQPTTNATPGDPHVGLMSHRERH